MLKTSCLVGLLLLIVATPSPAQNYLCEDQFKLNDVAVTPAPVPPEPTPDPFAERILKYIAIEAKHRLTGLASYYSTSLDGTLTANGETLPQQEALGRAPDASPRLLGRGEVAYDRQETPASGERPRPVRE